MPDRTTGLRRLLAELVAPPRCLACRVLAREPLIDRLCARCRIRLGATHPSARPPEGIHGLSVATEYRGPALGLVAALKSVGIPGAAETAAELIAEAMPAPPAGTMVVPVPARWSRSVRRGIDPATEIASALAPLLGLELSGPLRRLDRGRQRGRPRAARIADPPCFALSEIAPGRVLLVDDVLTTGATLSACAGALWRGGSERIDAAVLARTPVARRR